RVGRLPARGHRPDPRLLRDRLRQHLSPVPALPADALRAQPRAVRPRDCALARLHGKAEPAALARISLALEELILDISGLDAEGRGVARQADGKVVFVEGALPGERAAVRIMTGGKRFD